MTYVQNYATGLVQDKTGVLLIQSIAAAAPAGVGTLVIAGTAGKRIRVISAILGSSASVATMSIVSGSPGTVIAGPINLPATSQSLVLEPSLLGWWETLINGDDLYCFATTATVNISMRYIEVTY